MTFRYGRALGIRPELLELMDERISAVVPEEEKEETAVLVVGRGSSDPDANSDLAKISRLFFEGRPYPLVETAYVSMTPPDVAEGLERCRGSARGASSSSPTSCSPASWRSASASRARRSPARTPGSRCATPATSGRDGASRTCVLERYREAVEGDIRMNCDVCVHRVALPGFEEKVGAPATPHYHPDEPGHDHGHHHH